MYEILYLYYLIIFFLTVQLPAGGVILSAISKGLNNFLVVEHRSIVFLIFFTGSGGNSWIL